MHDYPLVPYAVSYDAPPAGDSDSDMRIIDGLPDPGPMPDEVVRQHEIAQIVRDLLRSAPTRVRLIFRLRYGCLGFPPMTHHEIGARMGFSRQRVQQIEAHWLGRFRAQLGAASRP